jgi:hypothetical protein
VIGILPVGWLALRRERRREWWWLAAALGVSFVADGMALGTHLLHRSQAPFISALYPVLQAAILGAVFLSRARAGIFATVLVLTGMASLAWPEAWLLDTVAWLGVSGIVWPFPAGPLRSGLLLIFGLGWLCWMGYALLPLPAWMAYQSCRLAGTILLCWAASRPGLRLA